MGERGSFMIGTPGRGPRRPRGDAGFTLVELMVALVLFVLAAMAVDVTFVSAHNAYLGSRRGAPLALAPALAEQVLRAKARAASCVLAPAAVSGGGAEDRFIGYVGADCAGTPLVAGVRPEYFVFCLYPQAEGRSLLLYNRAPFPPPAQWTCGGGPQWQLLSPSPVQVFCSRAGSDCRTPGDAPAMDPTGGLVSGFFRSAGAANIVHAKLYFGVGEDVPGQGDFPVSRGLNWKASFFVPVPLQAP